MLGGGGGAGADFATALAAGAGAVAGAASRLTATVDLAISDLHCSPKRARNKQKSVIFCENKGIFIFLIFYKFANMQSCKHIGL
jgi:hypothetical protein